MQHTPGGTAAEGADIPPLGTAHALTCTRRGKRARLGLIRGAPGLPSLVGFSLSGAAPLVPPPFLLPPFPPLFGVGVPGFWGFPCCFVGVGTLD